MDGFVYTQLVPTWNRAELANRPALSCSALSGSSSIYKRGRQCVHKRRTRSKKTYIVPCFPRARYDPADATGLVARRRESGHVDSLGHIRCAPDGAARVESADERQCNVTT